MSDILILIIVTLAARISVIVADLIILTVTWHKAAGTARKAHRFGAETPILGILLRDGQSIVMRRYSSLMRICLRIGFS